MLAKSLFRMHGVSFLSNENLKTFGLLNYFGNETNLNMKYSYLQ